MALTKVSDTVQNIGTLDALALSNGNGVSFDIKMSDGTTMSSELLDDYEEELI